VLVTGATGFIGRHSLPALLAAGYEVHAVSSAAATRPGPVHWHVADLLDADASAALIARLRPTHLLHFAWCVAPGAFWTSLENYRWLRASLALLEAFCARAGGRAVVAGTCAEYDWSFGQCAEATTPLQPATPYGVCKHALRLTAEALARQTGTSLGWGRIFHLYGPYEHPDRLVAHVIRALLQERTASCSAGTQLRDYLYVEDVAHAFVALLESGVQGPVNIASGSPIAVRELVSAIGAKLGREHLIQFGVTPPRAGDPPLLTADVSRLFQEVGWRPRYDLQRGVEATLAWWRSQPPER